MDALRKLADSFDRADVESAKALVAEVHRKPHREIDALIDTLQARVAEIKDAGKARELEAILKDLMTLVRIEQAELKSKLLPRLRTEGKRYRKFREVHARRANPGERVVSTTSDGRETENVAKPGDWIVRNTTKAREEYVVSNDKFEARYRLIEQLEDGWARYHPLGEVFGVEVDDGVLTLLGRSDIFFIEAPWGEAQCVRKGDEIATPPDFDEVYRIARAEFEDTYERAVG